MTGLHLWFTAFEATSKPFPSFGEGFISDYDRSNRTYRLYIRDAFHTDILRYAEQCERHGYQLVDFQFAIDREDSVHEFIPAYEITYQDFAFFEDVTDNSWQGNEQRPIEIHDGAWIVETANQIVCVEEVASVLKRIRPDFQWRPVETIDEFQRHFWRLIPKPEHSFLSRVPFVEDTQVFDWIATAAEPPDDLFFDTFATGPQAAYYPLIASRAVAMELERIFPDFPLFPIYPPNSETSRSVMRTFELLKPRIRRLQS
jgi:hypothetical protein